MGHDTKPISITSTVHLQLEIKSEPKSQFQNQDAELHVLESLTPECLNSEKFTFFLPDHRALFDVVQAPTKAGESTSLSLHVDREPLQELCHLPSAQHTSTAGCVSTAPTCQGWGCVGTITAWPQSQ